MVKFSGRADRCGREVSIARSWPPRLVGKPKDSKLGQVGHDDDHHDDGDDDDCDDDGIIKWLLSSLNMNMFATKIKRQYCWGNHQ